jgi:hypothetical protein
VPLRRMTKNVYLKAKHQRWILQTSIDATVSWLLVFGEHFGSSVDDCTALAVFFPSFIRVVFIVVLIVYMYTCNWSPVSNFL